MILILLRLKSNHIIPTNLQISNEECVFYIFFQNNSLQVPCIKMTVNLNPFLISAQTMQAYIIFITSYMI